MNRLRYLVLAAGFAMSAAITPVLAQTAPPADQGEQAPIGELDCRTLLRLSGEERDFTIIYFHGFISGRSNLQLLPVEELAEATDKVIDRCIDNPDDKVLTVFEQVRGQK